MRFCNGVLPRFLPKVVEHFSKQTCGFSYQWRHILYYFVYSERVPVQGSAVKFNLQLELFTDSTLHSCK